MANRHNGAAGKKPKNKNKGKGGKGKGGKGKGVRKGLSLHYLQPPAAATAVGISDGNPGEPISPAQYPSPHRPGQGKGKGKGGEGKG